MKRVFLAVVSALFLCGCVGRIIDWVPVTFYVEVQDKDGKDLLDPANDNSWLIGTEISFNGKIETIDEEDLASIMTRAVDVQYEGVRLQKSPKCYRLAFGEFSGAREYSNEVILIKWSDGSTNEITYKRRLNSVTVDAKEVFKLDGVKCSNPIVITK